MTIHNQNTQVVPVDSSHSTQDEINMLQLVIDLKARWKQLFVISFTGAALTIAIALIIPKHYKQTVVVTLPSADSTVKLNENGLTEYSRLSLLKVYYDKVRSVSFFRQFIESKQYLSKLYPDLYNSTSNGEQLFARINNEFEIKVLEPKVKKDEFINSPTQFSVSLIHTNEALLVSLLNEYVVYSNEHVIKQLKTEQSYERESRIALLNREIGLLKSNAKTIRELKIARIEVENNKQLDILNQRKELIIAKEQGHRLTEIATLEEDNKRKLNELEQQRTLLVSKAAQDRATQIAKAEEALKIATNLGIELPTRVDEMDSNNNGSTQINLNSAQELPLYLMGTKYLTTFVETLKNRENEEIFISEINALDVNIEQVRNHQALKTLQARESDAPFLTEIHDIDLEIERIKNDRELNSLKELNSDEPFIDILPEKLNTIAALNALSLDFADVNVFTLDQEAFLTNKPVKPSVRLLAIIGCMLSGILALMLVSISIMIERRKSRLGTSSGD